MKNAVIVALILIVLIQYNAMAIGWTGSINNDWHEPKNWVTNSVPTINDVVTINGNYTIEINAPAECKQISMNGSSVLTVNNSGTLLVDVGNTQNIGFFISSGDVVNLMGDVTIRNVLTSGGQTEAIKLYGVLTNYAILTVYNIVHTGYSGVNIRDAVFIHPGATFHNHKDIVLYDCTDTGINNDGSFINYKTGRIDIGNNIDKTGISSGGTAGNPGSFLNQGLITGSGESSQVSNSRYSTFTNDGILSIVNKPGILYSISNSGTFDNTSQGLIQIDNAGRLFHGLASATYDNTFTNDGIISIIDNQSSSFNSIFTFINNGLIDIDDSNTGMSTKDFTNNGDIDINNVSGSSFNVTGDFDNYGDINITNSTYTSQYVFRNLDDFNNMPSGTINIDGTMTIAFYNGKVSSGSPVPHFINEGSITIENTGSNYGMRNSQLGEFTQKGIITIGNNSEGILNEALFHGNGLVTTPYFRNVGDVTMGSGTAATSGSITISGDFENSLSGTLDLTAAAHFSPGIMYDQLVVQGNLIAGGDIYVDFTGGYVPSQAHIFDLITYGGSFSGFFDQVSTDYGSPAFQVTYEIPNIIRLKYDPCLGGVVYNDFQSFNGNWNQSSSWSLNHLPLPCENVRILGNIATHKNIVMDGFSAKVKSMTLTHATLTIPLGKTLTVNAEYQFDNGNGTNGIQMNSANLINNGNLTIKHIAENEAVEISTGSELTNAGIMSINKIEGTGAKGILNFGTFTNSGSGIFESYQIIPASYEEAFSIINRKNYHNDGNIYSETPITNFIDTAIMEGKGDLITPTLYNKGILSPGASIGTFSLEGDLVVEPSGTIKMEIEGNQGKGVNNGNDHIDISGSLTLAGTLEIDLINGYEPTNSNRFELIKYDDILTGGFDTEDIDANIASWEVSDLIDNKIILASDGECVYSSIEWTGNSGNLWNENGNWEPKIIPKGCHEAVIINNPTTVEIPPGENRSLSRLFLSDSDLWIHSNAKLNVNGKGLEHILMVVEQGSLINEGELTLVNSQGTLSHGLMVQSGGQINNDGVIDISHINGAGSKGILNLADIVNNGNIYLHDINNNAMNNLTSGYFQNNPGAKFHLTDCSEGIYNFSGCEIFINGSDVEFFGNFSGRTMHNEGLITVSSTGAIINATEKGTGFINLLGGVLDIAGTVY